MMMAGSQAFATGKPLSGIPAKAPPKTLRIVLDFSYDFGVDRRVITIDGTSFKAERDPGSRFARIKEGELSEDDAWELRSILRDRSKRHRMVAWQTADQYPKNGSTRHLNTWSGTEWTDFMYRLRASFGPDRLQTGWGGRQIPAGGSADDPEPVLVPQAVRDIMAILARNVGPL